MTLDTSLYDEKVETLRPPLKDLQCFEQEEEPVQNTLYPTRGRNERQ